MPDSAQVAIVHIVQRNRSPIARPEIVVEGVIAELEGVRPGISGRLHPDIAVPVQARAGRDQLAQDDVLLQTEQVIGLSVDGRDRKSTRLNSVTAVSRMPSSA